jgi:hypothetical protein
MTKSFGCWSGTYGMLCADDITVSASATTVSLIIVSLRLSQECAGNHASVVGLLI